MDTQTQTLEYLSDIVDAVRATERQISGELLAIAARMREDGADFQIALSAASKRLDAIQAETDSQYGATYGPIIWRNALTHHQEILRAVTQRLDERRAAGIIDPPDQPLNPDTFLDGFTETTREVPVPSDSTLGKAMAEYRERVASSAVEPLDPDTWTVEPAPVED